jgi:hypothetical protein
MVSKNIVIQLVIGLLLVVLLYSYISSRAGLGEGEFLVEDPSGDRMVIEVGPGLEAVDSLIEMHESGDPRWVGGSIEEHDSKFGFRFKPETVVVSEITAEGLQAVYYETIQENLTYWKGLGYVYIEGKVIGVPDSPTG